MLFFFDQNAGLIKMLLDSLGEVFKILDIIYYNYFYEVFQNKGNCEIELGSGGRGR